MGLWLGFFMRKCLARPLLSARYMKHLSLPLVLIALTPRPVAAGVDVLSPPQGTRWQSGEPGPVRLPGACRESVTDDPALAQALSELAFQIGGARRPLAGARIVGLTTVNEKALWAAVVPASEAGAQPLDANRAALLIKRLTDLGLFSSVKPTIEIVGDVPTLVIEVKEHPSVRRVVFEGLGELPPETLLGALLQAPSRDEVERSRALPRGGSTADAPRCPDPLPPREWVARAEDQVVFPGIVLGGPEAGLQRMVGQIFDRGYEMAAAAAQLDVDGTLTVRIDEGKIERIEFTGVEPRIENSVRDLLGVRPGQPFLRQDVEGALERVRVRFPFLRTGRGERPTRQHPRLVLEQASSEGWRWRTVEQPAVSERRWFTVEGRTLAVHLRALRFQDEIFAADLLRHTQVTSFAPGLEARAWLWDAADRMHLAIDAGGNVNTTRAQAAVVVPGEDERWRFDWTTGGRLQIPDARIAELGVTGYARVDTADRWRIAPIDSYIYSLLINRPSSEYFRRSGLTAFLTTHLADRVTAGVEYRHDSYRSVLPADEVFTFFNRDEAPFPNPEISEGQMGSLLFRIELATLPTPAYRVGTTRRDPERSIVQRDGERSWTSQLRTVNTVEVADPGLGGDFNFVRMVSDSAGVLYAGRSQRIKVRFRAAGKLGGDELPLQKQEALGGWTALRGYDFKEFRGGTFSLLGTAEYGLGPISLFVDVGSVRQTDSFGGVHAGVGGSLSFPDDVHLDVAWRTDDQAELSPEVRLLFQRTF